MSLRAKYAAAITLGTALGLGSGSTSSIACTTFGKQTKEGFVLAKNFDWHTGDGFIVVGPRDVERVSFSPGRKAWTSRFGNITFTTLGPGLPISGMNERGLTVETLVNSEGDAKIDGQPPLLSLEWVQFQLDSHETVSEVVASARKEPIGQLVVALHFMVCDKSGECAVIEPMAKGARISHGKDLPVASLANNLYSSDFSDYDSWVARNVGTAFRSGQSSPSRFAIAAEATKGKGVDVDDDFLATLDKAKIGGMTHWQLVWNLTKGSLKWREQGYAVTGTLRLADFDFACKESPMVRPIGKLRKKDGAFRPYAKSDEKGVADRMAETIGRRSRGAEDKLAKAIAAHTFSPRCAKPR